MNNNHLIQSQMQLILYFLGGIFIWSVVRNSRRDERKGRETQSGERTIEATRTTRNRRDERETDTKNRTGMCVGQNAQAVSSLALSYHSHRHWEFPGKPITYILRHLSESKVISRGTWRRWEKKEERNSANETLWP